jgi:hypothetical protein
MKHIPLLTLVLSLALGSTAPAQFGGPGAGPAGPNLSGAMTKFFGEHKSFSADVEVQTTPPRATEPMPLSGKLAVDGKKSRFEMDLANASGGGLPPGAAEQMKMMGMDKTIIIGDEEKKVNYLVYPGLTAYAEMSIKTASSSDEDLKVEVKELGKEKLDGQECVKNKMTVTEKNGKTHEATVWNAVALKNFPLKLETTQNGAPLVMSFKNVKLERPAAAQFEPPKDFKKYENVMALMQEEMMKRLGGPGN